MTTFVSLFRGINVGGHHKVPMAELKALHEALGFKKVVTYLQTGNVVFTADDTDPTQLSRQIEESFANTFGFPTPVLMRTAAQFNQILEHNPFANQPLKEPKWVLVLFLATRPTSAALQNLQEVYTGPEEMHLLGQEMYIYYPEGIGRSKLSHALLEEKLQAVGTGRNWNTVVQLQKLLSYGRRSRSHVGTQRLW